MTDTPETSSSTRDAPAPDRAGAGDSGLSGSPGSPARGAGGKRPLLRKQKMMNRVLYAMAPLIPASVYFFGWRVLAVLAVVHVAGLGTEYVMARRRGAPVSTACFVTIWLYALSLPPTVPWSVAVVGIVVAILFGKEVFGGFGKNIANPAIVGRAFVYICFPVAITSHFVPVFKGFPAGLAHWSWESQSRFPRYMRPALMRAFDGGEKKIADAVSTATPLIVHRDFGWDEGKPPLLDLATGSIGGTFGVDGHTRFLSAGSTGETSAILISLGAVYLLATGTANYRLLLGGLVGLLAGTFLLRHVLGFGGRTEVAPLPLALLAGPTLFAIVFMVTEPVSAPKKPAAMWAYAIGIGFLMILLRWKGVFAAAATFAILLGNLVAPLLDMGAVAWANRGKPTPEEERPAP